VTWVKLDDGFADHPKIESLSGDAYRAFIGGLCYCARFLTDGHIPPPRIKKLANRKVQGELERVGLWEPNGNGVNVHDYLIYQESREAVLERRRKDSERKAKRNP
jgi:hypothetical protein